MTRRQRRRRARRHPVLAAAAVFVALVVLAAAVRDARSVVMLGAVTAGIIYLYGRRARPAPRPVGRPAGRPVPRPMPSAPVPAAAFDGERDRLAAELVSVRAELARAQASIADVRTGAAAERDQLRAEVADLRRQLADARASAEAAWDAAAERPPVRHAEYDDAGGQRAALLADPLGGARPLAGTRVTISKRF